MDSFKRSACGFSLIEDICCIQSRKKGIHFVALRVRTIRRMVFLSELRSERISARRRHRRRARTDTLRIAGVIRVFILIRRKYFITCAGHVATCAGRLRTITPRIILRIKCRLIHIDHHTLFLIGCLRCVHRSSIYRPEKVLLR